MIRVSLGSVESMWPRAQRRLQGIRKETDSSTALECGFPPSQPLRGVSLYRITVQPAFLGTSPWVLPASSGPRGPWAQCPPGLVVTCKL